MNKERTFLSNSLFQKDFMQTKVKTNRIGGKERFLGHLLGPGMVYVFYCVVMGLRELYYMDIIRINEIYANNFAYLFMTTFTSIAGIATGFFINHMTEKTVCRAGRFRPYVLIGTWVMAIAGFCMFWSPFAPGSTVYMAWLYIFNFLYNCVGLPLWMLKDNMVSVISRNVLERNNITTMRNAVTNMIAGVVVSLGVIGMLYPMVLQHDLSGQSWRITIAVCGGVAIAFSLMEYFWTRERITEENQQVLAGTQGSATVQVPMLRQFKNALSNKYFLMSIAVGIGMIFYSNLQGGNSRVNMITYILGGNEQNGLQMLYLMVSMQPMAIGAFVIPILSRKFGARRIMQVSAVITLVGIGISLINPYSFLNAVAGGLVFACGIFAVTNMWNVFNQQAADDIEHKHGFRLEGTFANGLIVAIYTLILTPFSSIYETMLSTLGFKAPETVDGVLTVFQQNQAVENWMLFSYYGAYAIFAVIVFVVCIFFDLEKRMPQIQADLKERRKAAVLARGEEWIDEEEMERLEKEEALRLTEENRIADLKEKCAKKGLDFEKENQKYLAKVAKKEAKKNKKAAKAAK